MKAQTGLTLIEIAFVILLVGLLATIGVQRLGIGGRDLGEQLEAQDLALTELRRARAAALYQLKPENAVAVSADLQSVLDGRFINNTFKADPCVLEFSYDERGKVVKKASRDANDACPEEPTPFTGKNLQVQVQRTDSQSPLYVCVTVFTGRSVKGPC